MSGSIPFVNAINMEGLDVSEAMIVWVYKLKLFMEAFLLTLLLILSTNPHLMRFGF